MINISERQINTLMFNDPFKIIVTDNAIEKPFADELASTFPKATDDWYEYKNVFEKKRATDDIAKMPHKFARLLSELNMAPHIKQFEELTGIEGLIPDPWLRGGGLHQIFRGGKLDIHVDFNWHEHLKLDRRLNVLLYLNPGWKEEWGGHLECWDKDMKKCKVKILPVHNRMVIFETTDFSYHGHPEPLNCPENVTRNSMAWYFYSNGRPDHEKKDPHSTMFQKRPSDETTIEIEELRKKRNKGRVNGT